MKKYKHLFFDLDRTLWDFDKNSHETFNDIHSKYKLESLGVGDLNQFISTFQIINNNLWDLYRQGGIKKEVLSVERFALTLDSFGISDETLSRNLASDYISISPTKKRLYPGAIELLEYLKNKYQLHIITNGFEEVQHTKLAISGLRPYFTQVITSEDAGCKKPDPEIFRYALKLADASADESLMIGDDPEVDIDGAKAAGIDQLLVDYEGVYKSSVSTYAVKSLYEISEYL